jgi:hypothetical protein
MRNKLSEKELLPLQGEEPALDMIGGWDGDGFELRLDVPHRPLRQARPRAKRSRGATRFAIFALVSLLAACAGTSKPDAKRTKADIKYDQFKGSCHGLQSYIQDSGVQDCSGKFHPRWFGATRCSVAVAGYSFTPKRDKGWFGRTCFSIELPRNPNQFKIVSACTRIIEWQPVQPVDGICRDERQRWLDQVLSHEQYHIYQCESEVYKANQRWYESQHKFSGCGFTERGALSELRGKIEEIMETEQNRIMDAFERESEAFHQTTAGQPIITNCSQCSAPDH